MLSSQLFTERLPRRRFETVFIRFAYAESSLAFRLRRTVSTVFRPSCRIYQLRSSLQGVQFTGPRSVLQNQIYSSNKYF